MNYGYGTVMLSGISLVAPTSRLVCLWLLELYPEKYAEICEEHEAITFLRSRLGRVLLVVELPYLIRAKQWNLVRLGLFLFTIAIIPLSGSVCMPP